MKIAITGHTNGIGQALTKVLTEKGHTIVGISRRDGENIRRVAHTAKLIEPCDMFVNNAQSMFAQTELFYKVWERWEGQRKIIWNISSQMSSQPMHSKPDGLGDMEMSLYRTQKIALDEATRQLQNLRGLPRVTLIKPGRVKQGDHNASQPLEWATRIVEMLSHQKFHVPEISLVHNNLKVNP